MRVSAAWVAFLKNDAAGACEREGPMHRLLAWSQHPGEPGSVATFCGLTGRHFSVQFREAATMPGCEACERAAAEASAQAV